MRLAWLALLVVPALAAAQPRATSGTPHFWPADAPPAEDGPAPPEELAGFGFGWSEPHARRACRRAGHSWVATEERGTCGGALRELGFAAEISLRFCGDSICEVSARLDPAAAEDKVAWRPWAQAYRRLLRVMRGAFGAEVHHRVRAEEVCVSALQSERSAACFADEGHTARHWWEARGFELVLALGPSDRPGHRAPELTLTFRSPERVGEMSATSD